MKYVLIATVVLWSAVSLLYAETQPAEIRLRDLDISALSVNRSNLKLTATFDVKRAPIFDELIFDFYLLLRPQNKDVKLQFLHGRTVHRYIEAKSGYKSGVTLNSAALECIVPREVQYAVVITYQGKEVGVENSEKERWWEDPNLGAPVENILQRFAEVPIVRRWESAR